MNEYHIPAMLQETIDGLKIQPNGVYVDVTFGGGGHSAAILDKLQKKKQETRNEKQETRNEEQETGKLFSFDQDIEAFENAKINRPQVVNNPQWQFVHSNFRYLRNFMDYYKVNAIDGLIADLGVSFHHFDTAERGFSFRFEGPLDMRMNQAGGLTAADIINTYSEEQLANIFYLYGELKNGKQLARKIKEATGNRRQATGDKIQRIEELVQVLIGKKAEEANPMEKKMLTLAFQALRIEVNDELGALREMLCAARDLLAPGGRIAILTYHSLEDRIVKNFLRSGNLEGEIKKDFYGNILTPFTIIEKGLTASQEEVDNNPRSRSAKLRVAEKRV
ncbi:MAG: 16S rRNA (cytosine(1402)-N(4))-methyltransferase RsmH [Paludibacteraceae bacterium]|nr:16S rRNA (cytosine(1402)-N(4))-methyltransferase RsmH [Paludibacteraceae bacterium]